MDPAETKRVEIQSSDRVADWPKAGMSSAPTRELEEGQISEWPLAVWSKECVDGQEARMR